MKAIILLFVDIALLRRGPEDVPRSVLLLAITVVGYLGVNLAVIAALPSLTDERVPLELVDTTFTLAWYYLLMRLFRRAERFEQTTTAVFGYQIILTPLLAGVMWLVTRVPATGIWFMPVAMLALGVFGWVLAVNCRVLQSALGQPLLVCAGLIIAQVAASQILLRSIFTVAQG